MKIFSDSVKELILKAQMARANIFLSKELIHDITDCMNRKIEVDIVGPFCLIFIDPKPSANWSHECYYIIINKNQECRCIEHNWPPSSKIVLER